MLSKRMILFRSFQLKEFQNIPHVRCVEGVLIKTQSHTLPFSTIVIFREERSNRVSDTDLRILALQLSRISAGQIIWIADLLVDGTRLNSPLFLDPYHSHEHSLFR